MSSRWSVNWFYSRLKFREFNIRCPTSTESSCVVLLVVTSGFCSWCHLFYCNRFHPQNFFTFSRKMMFLLLTALFYHQMRFPSQCNKIGAENALFISNTLISNTRLKLAKNQANAKQHPEVELLLFENYSHSSSILSSKINGTNSVIRKRRSMSVKIKVKIKNRSHRHDINRPTSRHEHKYSKYKKCLGIVILICVKQHLSNMRRSIPEKVKQHGVEKSVSYKN